MTDHAMDTTSITLIRRLQQPADGRAWERFAELYTPLVYHWARRIGLDDPAASDVVQDVFTVLVEKMPTFEYDQTKSFRAWLCTLTRNKCRDVLRRHKPVASHGAVDELVETADAVNDLSEQEHRQMLARRALELMQTEFISVDRPPIWESLATLSIWPNRESSED